MKKKLTLLVVLSLLFAPAMAFESGADTAEGEANIGNVGPSVVSFDVSTGTVNPESYFTVDVRARDNNQLNDLDNVIVTLYDNSVLVGDADDKRNHYTFWFDPSDNTWHSSPSTNSQGEAYIDSGGSSYPADLSVTEDNYSFRVLLNGTGNPNNDWDVQVEVEDEAANDTLTSNNEFSVSTYLTYTMNTASIEWGSLSVPDSDVASDNNPVDLTQIETNVDFDVQTRLENADWKSGSDTLAAENTEFDTTSGSTAGTDMTTSFQDVHSSQSYGEGKTRSTYYYMDVPSGTKEGVYTNTFYLEVVQN